MYNKYCAGCIAKNIPGIAYLKICNTKIYFLSTLIILFCNNNETLASLLTVHTLYANNDCLLYTTQITHDILEAQNLSLY